MVKDLIHLLIHFFLHLSHLFLQFLFVWSHLLLDLVNFGIDLVTFATKLLDNAVKIALDLLLKGSDQTHPLVLFVHVLWFLEGYDCAAVAWLFTIDNSTWFFPEI